MAVCITLMFAAILVSAGVSSTSDGEYILHAVTIASYHYTLYAGCSDKYTDQPPTELNCDPLHTTVTLQCATGSNSHEVTWYWTQNFSDAGIRGEEILPGSSGSVYTVSVFNTHMKHLTFSVLNSSLGYYWCEISNAVNVSLRPSTITPICAQQASSRCNESYILGIHHIEDECAMENSPLAFNRPPLPMCFLQAGIPDIVSSTILLTTTQTYFVPSNSVTLKSSSNPALGTSSSPALDTTHVMKLVTTSLYKTTTETPIVSPTSNLTAPVAFPLSWILVVVLGILLFVVFGSLVIVLVIFKRKIALLRNWFGKLL